MMKVGLSGNFFSGFTDVSDYLEKMKVPVFDGDLVIKFMLNYSKNNIEKVKKTLGKDIYRDNLLDLKRIETTKDFDRVIDIIEVDLFKSFEKWRINNWTSPYTVFKSSILFERNWNKSMNMNINVYRPITYRKGDISTLTNIPSSRINFILDNEMDELDKNGQSDFVIHNYLNSYYGISSVGFQEQIKKIDRSILKKCPN